MRRLLLFAMGLLISVFLVTNSYAAQDRSFTNINSAGMFEDTYDFFKLSPAYLPSFQKATLWTQLSNLFNTTDDLMDGSGNSYFLLGGQADFMGIGRIGAMVDWDSDISPQAATDANGNNANGHASSTRVDYLDTNSDTIIDTKAVRTAEIEKYYNFASKDIYVAFAMGAIDIFDVGASIRADLDSYDRSYNPWLGGSPSLKETFEARTTSLLSGVDTSLQTYERSGNLDYGTDRYDLTVGARTGKLLTNIDLVANVGFIFNPVHNNYEYTFEQTIDADLSNPNTKSYDKTMETGFEPGNGFYPGTGIGGLAEVRGEYQWNSNIRLIGEVMFDVIGRGISDAKQERETVDRDVYLSGLDTYTDEVINSATDTYEGDVTDMMLGLSLRAIYQGEGWRLGMGLRASSDSSTSEITTKTENNDVTTLSGRPVAANNSVATTTSALTSVLTNRSVSEIVEIPVGLQIDILKNLPIYFGAAHRVTFTESSTSHEVTERSLVSTTTVNGDGSTSSTTNEVVNSQEAYNDSGLTSVHNTYYYYGLTWWPKENIQIDIKNIYRWDYWRDYELSFTLHF